LFVESVVVFEIRFGILSRVQLFVFVKERGETGRGRRGRGRERERGRRGRGRERERERERERRRGEVKSDVIRDTVLLHRLIFHIAVRVREWRCIDVD
jgi:hypothetical protein